MVASAQLPLNFAFFCIFSHIICDINAATLCIINTNTLNTHTQTHPLLKLEALSTLGTPEVGGIGYFSAAVLQDVVHQVDVGQLHG